MYSIIGKRNINLKERRLKKKKIYDVPRFNNIKEIIANTIKLYPNNNAFILKTKNEDQIIYNNISFTMFRRRHK